MHIEHLALYVQDLEGMKQFYQRYFNAQPNSGYHNPKTGLRSYFLTFEEGCRLELMHRPEVTGREKPPIAAGYIHLAFTVGERARVDALTQQLRQDGYTVCSGPRVTGDGYYESCILDPEGNQIELVAAR